ncbi:MAG: hypothetical protein E7182_05580 [Erysipelotrichaceae bacterium]|nr:hypothetical protein [Erysipelotrichaceae bacterium]
MKKAINVLVLISKILSIVLAVLYVILMIVNFAQAPGATGATRDAFISSGVSNIFQLSFAIAAIIVTYLNGPKMNEETASKAEAIVAIVFGALGCPTLAAAGIVYLVLVHQKEKGAIAEAPTEPSDSEQR